MNRLLNASQNRVCQLFGIQYPIVLGGLAWIGNAELAAAVSNAGGLGMLTPNGGAGVLDEDMTQNLRKQIRKARSLTDKPFGVTIGMEIPEHKDWIRVCMEEGVGIVATAAGDPALHTEALKKAGAKVMHLVFSVKHALHAEAVGVDAVVTSSFEAGSFISREELTNFVLIPQVADAVKIPVIAAGGIADARGFVAAMALGAEAVQLGTRFIATEECPAHPNYKEAVLRAGDTDTTVTGRGSLLQARVLKNRFARQIQEREEKGVSAEELVAFITRGRFYLASIEGNTEDSSMLCGSVAGMVKEITGAGEVVKSLVEGYNRILSRLIRT